MGSAEAAEYILGSSPPFPGEPFSAFERVPRSSPSPESPMQSAGMLLLLATTLIHSSPPTQEGKVLEEDDQRRKNSAHLMKPSHHGLF